MPDMELKKYDVISLDLWDTVIRRKCHPDAIKEQTSDYLMTNYYAYIAEEFRTVDKLTQRRIQCERIIGEEATKNGLDDEYEIHKVFECWIDTVMPQYVNGKIVIHELYEFELQTELENAYLDPDIVMTVEGIPHNKLVYISDFYAGTEFVDKILEHIECPLNFDKKYISCECGYNKRSGRLFRYAGDDMKISPQQQLHIGDNQYSDGEIPGNQGIKTKLYLPTDEHENRIRKEKDYARLKEEEEPVLGFADLKSKGEISIFFYGFVHWIIESCLQDGIEELYFFTREGEFYKQVYDEIVKNEYVYKKVPRAEILEVSRVSTFCASLREISLTEMMRIWNQYSIQSMEALLKSLGIAKDLVSPYMQKYQIRLEEVITYPWQDDRIIALFNDTAFLEMMQRQRDSKRELLMGYLVRKGISVNEKKRIGIVDIGWRGTIQDNISYLLPNHQLKGYYIGLIPFLNEQPVNTIKHGYLNGYDKFNLLLQYVMPFEMISNSPNGSVVGYEKRDGVICAIRKKEEEEDYIYYQYTQKVQKEVITDISQIGHNLKRRVHVASDIRALAHMKLSNYILYPQRSVAEAYFSLRHNEEFGVGEYVDKTTVFRWDLFVKACFGRKHRSRLAQFLRDTTWPQGYLVKYHLYLLVKLYNKRYSEE